MIVFIKPYKVVQSIFEAVDEILKCGHSNNNCLNSQYFQVVVFVFYSSILFILPVELPKMFLDAGARPHLDLNRFFLSRNK